MQRIDANINKQRTYVNSIPPIVHVLVTIIMSICVLIFGLILTMAPGIVMTEEVFLNRLPFVFVPKNFFLIIIILLSWGHYVCGIKERYVRKEIIVFWPCAFLGLYAALVFTSYTQYWQLKSGGGYIDIYPDTPFDFWLRIFTFIAFWPVMCCQCAWSAIKGTIGRFFGSSLALILWFLYVNSTYSGPPIFAFVEIFAYFILLSFFSAPGFAGAAIQGFFTGAFLSQCVTVSLLGLFEKNNISSLLSAYLKRPFIN